MARLRALNPGNYRSSEKIGQDIENIIRYLNAAEIGDKTLAELLSGLYDDDGEFAGPIEFRFDADSGLEVRIGSYSDPDEGWDLVANASDLRGNAGTDFGLIGTPLFHNRQDFLATASQTTFSYSFDSDEESLLVTLNGLLQREGASYDYTTDDVANQVIFNAPLSLNDKVTIFSIREDNVQDYVRTDTTATNGQAVFAFPHTDDQELMVYRNGVLQREGGSYDYTTSADLGVVTFTTGLTGGDIVSIITVQNAASTVVAGLMTEDAYGDGDGGILGSKISFADESIPQEKIVGLATAIANNARITVSSSEPSDPDTRDLWLDTSQSPNILKVWNSYAWVETSPNINIPEFDSGEAFKVLRVNSTGSDLEWVNVDLSSRVANSSVGAVNGVCPLDSDGLVPVAYLPEIYSQVSLYKDIPSGLTAASYTTTIVYGQVLRIDAIALKTNAGTCNVDIEVNGVVVTTASIGATSTLTGTTLPNSISVDGSSTPKRIAIKVSSVVTATQLEATLATVALSS